MCSLQSLDSHVYASVQFLSLTLDGVTGAIQERLRQSYDASAYHMMFAVNVYACFYLGAGRAQC